MSGRRRWTDAEILAALRAAAEATGRPLTSAAYHCWRNAQMEVEGPSLKTVRRRFTSWTGALRCAGLAPYAPHTRADLVASVVILAHALGRPPSLREWASWPDRPTGLTWVVDEWGSWNEVIATARILDRHWPEGSHPNSRAIAHLLAVPDERLTDREREVASLVRAGHSLAAAARVLGISTQLAHRIAWRAGIPAYVVTRRPRWTRVTATARLQEWLDDHEGIPPTMASWDIRDGKPSVSTLMTLFGSWRAAWLAADPAVPPRPHGGQKRGGSA